MKSLRDLPAPAKLNLFLHVMGRRSDGYHRLQTVFRLIDLADTLHLEARTDGRIQRVTPLPGVPSHECLTVRAAQALQQATGSRAGVDIHLHKQIPAGGGLGGGSSDAATVLLALNRLWDTRLQRDQLLALALTLGADVPFFVFGQNAFAEGVGEALTAIELPAAWYVVLQPRAMVATASIFADPDLTRDSRPVIITDFPSCRVKGREASNHAGASVGSPQEPLAGGPDLWGRNDLEPVVLRRYPEVAVARQVAVDALARSGRPGSSVRLTGSGACLFIECASAQQATSIQAEIAATIRQSKQAATAIGSVAACAGLSSHPLQSWAVQAPSVGE